VRAVRQQHHALLQPRDGRVPARELLLNAPRNLVASLRELRLLRIRLGEQRLSLHLESREHRLHRGLRLSRAQRVGNALLGRVHQRVEEHAVRLLRPGDRLLLLRELRGLLPHLLAHACRLLRPRHALLLLLDLPLRPLHGLRRRMLHVRRLPLRR